MASPTLGGSKIGEEELQQTQVAQLRGSLGRPAEPLAEGSPARVGDAEESPPPTLQLALLGHQTELDEARRLLVEQGVREGPEVADRSGRVTLEVVGRGGPLSRQESEHEMRGRRQGRARTGGLLE